MSDIDCLCAHCRVSLKGTKAADIVQQPVFDFDGTLDSIELAHRRCQPDWAVYDAWPKGMTDVQVRELQRGY